MNQVSLFALVVLTVLSVALWVLGNRFARRYVAIHRTRPPLTWMFRRTDDPELETPRRFALVLLPFHLASLAVYLLQS